MKKISTSFITILALLVLAGGFYFAHNNEFGDLSYPEYSVDLTHEALAARFDYLSQQGTNSCGGGENYIAQLSSDGQRIQGSCCSPMTLHSYEEQIEGLKKYTDYDIIPPDPYDVSAEWADRMIKYTKQTNLKPKQQAIYDKAVEISHEGGPCCCVCWHWYAYQGLAKHLIVENNFNADQIAEIWDLSDACGGEHVHD